jgi:hypothetical protein
MSVLSGSCMLLLAGIDPVSGAVYLLEFVQMVKPRDLVALAAQSYKR